MFITFFRPTHLRSSSCSHLPFPSYFRAPSSIPFSSSPVAPSPSLLPPLNLLSLPLALQPLALLLPSSSSVSCFARRVLRCALRSLLPRPSCLCLRCPVLLRCPLRPPTGHTQNSTGSSRQDAKEPPAGEGVCALLSTCS